jgi:hypothetical protein
MQALQKTDFWDPTFFPHVLLGLFTVISYERPSIAVRRSGLRTRINVLFTHNGAPPQFFAYSLGILEKSISGTMDGTRRTNSVICSFPWFKSLVFLSLGTSEFYCLCDRTQRRPGLATKNTECIWAYSYDTWNFPASQAVAVQTFHILCWSSRWTLWESYWVVRGP